MRQLLDRAVEQLERGRVRPMRVLEDHQHRPAKRQRLDLGQQRGQGQLALSLGVLRQRWVAALGRESKKVGEQSSGFDTGLTRLREQRFELVEPDLGPVVSLKASSPFELRDERVERAVAVMRRAKKTAALVCGSSRSRSSSAAIRRDLPMPGSPETSTICPSPAFARCHRRTNRSISSPRPTSGVSAVTRNASNRLSTALGCNTCQAGTASVSPLTIDGAEIAVLEEIADQPARARGDHDRVRPGQRLKTGGEIGCLADNRLLLRRAFADQVADDHEPGGDADARLQLKGLDVETADSVDRAEPGRERPALQRFHGLADSRNRPGCHRPYILRHSHRTRRRFRRRRGDTRL